MADEEFLAELEEYGNRGAAASRAAAAWAVQEIRRLESEGVPGVMHAVDRAFADLTVMERDFARTLVRNREQTIEELEEHIRVLLASAEEVRLDVSRLNVHNAELRGDRDLLEAYRVEVREMRVEILALVEVWDHLTRVMNPEHEYLPKNARAALQRRVDGMREQWGWDVVREDGDGAPFPDQPRDWREPDGEGSG